MALRTDGSIVIWNDSGSVKEFKSANDMQIYPFENFTASSFANNNKGNDFVAVLSNGSIKAYDGFIDEWYKKDSLCINCFDENAFLNFARNVTEISSSEYGFAMLRADGSVYSDILEEEQQADLNGNIKVIQICTTDQNFAALREDGSVIAWGGGFMLDSSIEAALDGAIPIKKLYSIQNGFAALREDGSVVTWFINTTYDGAEVFEQLNDSVGVKEIYTTEYAFAALRNDGTIVTWGDRDAANSSSVIDKLTGIVGLADTST